MKKRVYLTSLLLGLLAMGMGCDDKGKSVIQAEYQKVVLFKTSGVVDLTVYKTGTDTDYKFTVLRSGMSPKLTASASVGTMSAEEFNAYCDDRGLNLTMIPADCYQLSQEALSFQSNERYKSITLKLHTNIIDELAASESEYVIPLILTSKNATVNSEQNVLFLKPHVVIPAVAFSTPGISTQYCGNGKTTINVPLKLQIQNNWNFTCKVEVDESLTDGNPLLKSGYTLENGGVVSFTEGEDEAILKVTFDRSAADFGLDMNTWVLPLVVKEISLSTFDIDPNPYILGVTAKYPLTIEVLSTNAQEPKEGPLANVLDGKVSTYFHSRWSGTPVGADHYIEIQLTKPLTEFMFSYTTRHNNANVALGVFDVMVSGNGTDFTLLRSYDKTVDALPVGKAEVFNSTVLQSVAPVTSIRFVCKKSNTDKAWFALSELSLYAFE